MRRGDGQTLQITALLYAVLEAIDGRRDLGQIAAAVSARIERSVVAEDVAYLIQTKLADLGVLRRADGSQPTAAVTSNPLLALRWRFVVSNPRITRRITRPFAVLFRPYVVLPVLVAFALTSGWLLLDKGLASATYQALYEPGLLLLIFGLTMLSAGFHEFGHAAACRYGGATPGAMGVGLYLVWPAFYTEVTDSYRLGRWGRVRVDIGGLYFNAIFAIAMVGVWAATGWDALLLVVPAQLLQMVRQLLPFVRFDGYHILADLTGVPDLFSHIRPTLLGVLPRRRHEASAGTLKPWARAVVTLWVIVVIPVLLLSLFLMVKVFPRVAATAWDSLGQQYDVLQTNWADGQLADVGVRLLSMFTIALPLAGMAYLLGRIVRRTIKRAAVMTQGRPIRRTGAIILAGAAVALAAWAWWPQGQYKPVTPAERGTLLHAFLSLDDAGAQPSLPAMALLGAPQALPLVNQSLAVTSADFGEVAGASDAVLEDAQPRLAMLLTPRPVGPVAEDFVASGGGEPIVLLAPASVAAQPWAEAAVAAAEAPATEQVPATAPVPAAADDTAAGAEAPAAVATSAPDVQAPEAGEWVFPFNAPDAPRAQDNQALALNTQDGATTYDVAFAIVWVTDGGAPLDHRNEAFAFASCTDCTTVAVAFQVILAIGQVDVVVPENISMAINYGCDACTTYALAVQLVATLTEMPSDEAMAAIAAVWDEVEALDLAAVGVEGIQAQLAAAEAAILQILLGDDGADGPDTADDGTAADPAAIPTETSTPTADGDGAAGATEEPTAGVVAATPTPSPGATASPEGATGEPPAPSGEPSETSTPTPQEQESAGPTATSEPTPEAEPTTDAEFTPDAEPSPEPASEEPADDGGATEGAAPTDAPAEESS